MGVLIEALAERHFEGLHRALDSVARERRFLASMSARHVGIGARLMQAACASAKGLTRIEITVRADNANAKALYEGFGFRSRGAATPGVPGRRRAPRQLCDGAVARGGG